jgi:PRC-barrel domain
MVVSARKLLDIALIASVAYATAQSAFGQVVRPAAPPQGQVVPGRPGAPNQTFDRDDRRQQGRILQGSAIIGSSVMLQGGASWGTVRDFVISDSGCLQYAVIGADNGLVAVPWGVGTFDFGRRAFVLDFGRDRIREFPQIRDVAELRDPRVQQRMQTFFRGDHNMRGDRDNRGTDVRQDNRQRGTENQPQRGTTNRGAAPATPGTANGNQKPAPAPENRGEEHRPR